MKTSELRQNYPKAIAQLEDWVKGNLNKDYSQMKTDMKPEEFISELIEIILVHNPRHLFGFFDEKGLQIAIIPPTKEGEMWVYWNSDDHYSFTASSRAEAEERAFVNAFKSLEENGS